MQVVKATADMQVNDFGYEHDEKSYSVAQFIKLDTFVYNDPLQRGYVWTLLQKSELIVTILEGGYVPSVVAEIIKNNKKKIRNIIDGKQRLTLIRDYRKDKFALDSKTPYIKGVDESGTPILIDISGLKFSELPESMQEKINAFIIRVIELEFEDEEMKKKFFARLNNGKALSPHEFAKSKMSWDLISYIAEVRNEPVLTTFLSEKARDKDENGKMVQQALRLLAADGDTALSSSVILDFIKSGQADDKGLQEKLRASLKYLSEAIQSLDEKQQKKVLGVNKVVTLTMIAIKAIQSNVPTSAFTDWLIDFFITDYKNHNYSMYAAGKTSDKNTVRERVKIAMDHFGDKVVSITKVD